MKEVTILQIYKQVCEMPECEFSKFCDNVKEGCKKNIYAINFIEIAGQKRH